MGAPHCPVLRGEGGETSPNILYIRTEFSHNHIQTGPEKPHLVRA